MDVLDELLTATALDPFECQSLLARSPAWAIPAGVPSAEVLASPDGRAHAEVIAGGFWESCDTCSDPGPDPMPDEAVARVASPA